MKLYCKKILAEIDVWWGTYASEIETVIKDLDFTNKTIRIVTTHEDLGLANIFRDTPK